MRNRYLLFLYNNYSNEKYCLELFNVSCDPDRYVFEDFDKSLPADFPYGVYDYALVHCSIPYSVDLRPILLDTVITVNDEQGEKTDFALRQLSPETGLLEFRPDAANGQTWENVQGDDRLYLDM